MQELKSLKIKIFTKSASLVETELDLIILIELNPSFQQFLEEHFHVNPELTLQKNTQLLSGRRKSQSRRGLLQQTGEVKGSALRFCLNRLRRMRFP